MTTHTIRNSERNYANVWHFIVISLSDVFIVEWIAVEYFVKFERRVNIGKTTLETYTQDIPQEHFAEQWFIWQAIENIGQKIMMLSVSLAKHFFEYAEFGNAAAQIHGKHSRLPWNIRFDSMKERFMLFSCSVCTVTICSRIKCDGFSSQFVIRVLNCKATAEMLNDCLPTWIFGKFEES